GKRRDEKLVHKIPEEPLFRGLASQPALSAPDRTLPSELPPSHRGSRGLVSGQLPTRQRLIPCAASSISSTAAASPTARVRAMCGTPARAKYRRESISVRQRRLRRRSTPQGP